MEYVLPRVADAHPSLGFDTPLPTLVLRISIAAAVRGQRMA
jgi:hypothetical protein